MNKKLLSCFGGALAVCWIGAMGACIAPPESEESDDEIMEVPEEAGEADVEGGIGSNCSPVFGEDCDDGFTCCTTVACGGTCQSQICRDLNSDEANCGQCGHRCPSSDPPGPPTHYVCFLGTCTPV